MKSVIFPNKYYNNVVNGTSDDNISIDVKITINNYMSLKVHNPAFTIISGCIIRNTRLNKNHYSNKMKVHSLEVLTNGSL